MPEGKIIKAALLTGGGDRPYVFGLATSLMGKRVALDVIGSDDVDFPEFHGNPIINFLNFRGSSRADVGFAKKVSRILLYYFRLIRYAATASPRIFHILWNNKFEYFDRTLLILYYRLMRKSIVLTAHNVNEGRRDAKDSSLNRLTLKFQYRQAKCIFAHTEKMKQELIKEFDVRPERITVIPFGINNSISNTCLTTEEAKRRLGLGRNQKALLFYGRIAPRKGLEYLVAAFHQLLAKNDDYRLIIAGGPDRCEKYWNEVHDTIHEDARKGRILLRAEFVPDEETEVYFKAADVLVLPYRDIFQSGVLFLGYNFGLPALVADVGSLKDSVVEGKTGFAFKPENPADLADVIEEYFASDLYANLEDRRREIRDYVMRLHSWDVVGQKTMSIYAELLRVPPTNELSNYDASGTSLNAKFPS